MPSPEHDDLVALAEKWLSQRKCQVVISGRVATYCAEIPDVIGWQANGDSMLIEVKVSLGDWRDDAKKSHRDNGIGRWRWYLTPKGMLDNERIWDGWGLLEYDGRVVRIKKGATVRTKMAKMQQELALIVSMYRRRESKIETGRSLVRTHIETGNGIDALMRWSGSKEIIYDG